MENVMPFVPKHTSDADRALAANLRERARAVELAGDPVIPTFTNPSFRELQAEERRQADAIAEFAATTIFGVRTRDRLTLRIAMDLEGAATYLLRRIHPEWMRAAHEQAVEGLLASDEFRAVMRSRSLAEARIIAHRFGQTFLAALIGTLENERTVAPSTYLKIAAAKAEAGAL